MKQRDKKRGLVAAQLNAQGQPEKVDFRQANKEIRRAAQSFVRIAQSAIALAESLKTTALEAQQVSLAMRERQSVSGLIRRWTWGGA